MGSFDWKGVVSKAAPWLGAALGGPLGASAGKLIASALGGDPTKATPDELAKLVQNVTPEQLLALKQADHDFQLRLKQMDINEVKDLEALAVQDRASAREREIRTSDSWTPRIIAGVVVLGWLGAQGYLLRNVVDPAMRDIVMRMLGTLDAALTLVLSYYFGSSASSRVKDELLYRAKPGAE